MANTKNQLFQKRRLRVRNKLCNSARDRPRLCVNRSNKNISVQLIDDAKGVTIASASSLEKGLGVVGSNNLTTAAKIVRLLQREPKKLVWKNVILIEELFFFMEKLKLSQMLPVRAV